MSYTLSLCPRALAEIKNARESYEVVGHGGPFLAELEAVLDAVLAVLPQRCDPAKWPRR